jgi:hypothetical protein
MLMKLSPGVDFTKKRKKYSQVVSLFVLLKYAGVKATHKMLVKSTPA